MQNQQKMGCDVSAIGNHSLKTKDIKCLAEDISDRMDINIVCSYWGQKEFFKLLGETKEDQYVTIGKIIKDENFKTYELIDSAYQLKELHYKLGDDLFYNPAYWEAFNGKAPEQSYIAHMKKELVFSNYELIGNSGNDYEFLFIQNENYDNGFSYYSRWWAFCKFFTEGYYKNEEYLSELMNYRRELMKLNFRLGGNKMYYVNDQSEALRSVDQDYTWEFSWPEFEAFVKEKTAELMLEVPLFFTDKNYREAFLQKGEYPLSFIDDFSDIR